VLDLETISHEKRYFKLSLKFKFSPVVVENNNVTVHILAVQMINVNQKVTAIATSIVTIIVYKLLEGMND
jgi:hypothetical protein